MLNWFYKWRLWGYIFVWEKVLPQSHRDKPCAQSARRQRPCCRHFRRCISSSKMNVPLTQVALVARPCAPAAQLTDDSSSSSRRLAISMCPLRGHLILSKTAPSVCLEKMIMLRWSPSDKLIRPGEKLIFQSSVQTAFKSLRLLRRRLDLKKQSSLRTDSFQPTLRVGTLIFKTAGGARAAVRKKHQKNFILNNKNQKCT